MSNPQFCMSHRQTMIGVLAWGPLKRRLDFAWAALLLCTLVVYLVGLLMDFHIQDFSILQFDSPAFDFYWSEWSIESIWGVVYINTWVCVLGPAVLIMDNACQSDWWVSQFFRRYLIFIDTL